MENPDQIFPLFVMQVMGDIPCIPGLFVAGVFSGALSTVSSGLNALAAVTFQDIIQGFFSVKMEEKTKTLVAKVLALGYGIIGYLIVFLVKYLPGVLEVSNVIQCIYCKYSNMYKIKKEEMPYYIYHFI